MQRLEINCVCLIYFLCDSIVFVSTENLEKNTIMFCSDSPSHPVHLLLYFQILLLIKLLLNLKNMWNFLHFMILIVNSHIR